MRLLISGVTFIDVKLHYASEVRRVNRGAKSKRDFLVDKARYSGFRRSGRSTEEEKREREKKKRNRQFETSSPSAH